jgi:hypothetical protein
MYTANSRAASFQRPSLNEGIAVNQTMEEHLRRIRLGVGMIAGMLAFILGSTLALGLMFALEDEPWGMAWAAIFVGLLAGAIACLAVTDRGAKSQAGE